jgi:hypothetical protein
MNNSPSPDCEKTICSDFKGKKGTEKNCNKVYYYLKSTKTHPDGGWFTCRNGGDDGTCRSKGKWIAGRTKAPPEFYTTEGLLYKAFVSALLKNPVKEGDYVFQKVKSVGDCNGSPVVYLARWSDGQENKLEHFSHAEANEAAVDLFHFLNDNTNVQSFFFKTAQDGKNGWFKKMLEDKTLGSLVLQPQWMTNKRQQQKFDEERREEERQFKAKIAEETLGSLGNLSQPQLVTNKRQQQKFDEERREEERQYIAQIEEETRRRKEEMEKRRTFATPPNTQGGSGTKRKRKKRRRKTRVKRKKTQKRKKAKRKYKKRRTKRRR